MTIIFLFIGLAGEAEHHDIGRQPGKKARRLGKKLLSSARSLL